MQRLHLVDLIILMIYLLGVTAVGWRFSRRQRTIWSYFLSDKHVPWWALAGSIVATETSTATFISVPAYAFGGNLTFLQIVVGYMIGRVFVVWFLIPLYFKGELYTAYQVLDQRFGGSVKRVAAGLFLATRSVADGIRLYATAIVVVALTGWRDSASILLVGAVTIVYTYMGGMAAVIWTDVAQLIIYLAGAIAAAGILLNRIPGGWETVASFGELHHKFQLVDLTWSFSRSYTLWAGIIGGAFLATATHGTDQLMVQRYLCARDARQASRALLASSSIVFVQFVLFLMIGVMLFVFYNLPGASALSTEVAARPDRVFPHFIVSELPVGLVGLVVAAILAAAMSTLSSSLNSSSATALTDFYRPLVAPGRSEAHYLGVSRGLTAMWGIVQIVVALIAIRMSQSIVDTVLAIASFTSGPILGLFFLGTFTKRVKQRAALAGVAAGIAFMISIWLWSGISWQWYVLVGSGITFLVGFVVSLAVE